MKAYTDLDQSKKLAEILPIKSADMRFCFSHTLGGRIIGHYPMIGREPSLGTIPCWSLTALLNVLPSATLDSSDDHHYRLYCKEMFTDWYDNPIDASIEMIDRLHKQMVHDFNNS